MKNDNFKTDSEDSIYLAELFNEIEKDVMQKDTSTKVFREALSFRKSSKDYIKVYTYQFTESQGKAAFLRGNVGNVPRITETGDTAYVNVEPIGVDIAVSDDELSAARDGEKDILRSRTMGAIEAVEATLDQLAALGKGNSTGLLNNASVGVDDLSVAGTHDGWVANSRTAIECVETIQNAIKTVRVATKGHESPDTLILPTEAWEYLQIVSDGAGTASMTGMELLKRRMPNLKIHSWSYCDNAAAGGSSNRAVVFDSRDDRVHMLMVQDVQRTPFKDEGVEGQVARCKAASAGCIILRPASVRYIDDL